DGQGSWHLPVVHEHAPDAGWGRGATDKYACHRQSPPACGGEHRGAMQAPYLHVTCKQDRKQEACQSHRFFRCRGYNETTILIRLLHLMSRWESPDFSLGKRKGRLSC